MPFKVDKKIIDVNVMLGPWHAPTRYRTPDGLLRVLDDYRIASAVVYHSAAQMVPWQYNAEITRLTSESGGRLLACHVLDPMLAERSEPGEGSLGERLRASRPAAVRLLPKTQRYPLSAFFCGQVLGALNELRLPLLLDAAEAPPLEDLPPLARDYPDLPIVILRHYFISSRALTPLLVKLDNVYLDVNTIIDTGYLEELVDERCGSEKLLLGSGLPHHVPAGGLSMVLYSTMEERHKHNILHANWERLQGDIRYDDQG
jgi:predicted TIM-barrel fold metal-dependent hydrolase